MLSIIVDGGLSLTFIVAGACEYVVNCLQIVVCGCCTRFVITKVIFSVHRNICNPFKELCFDLYLSIHTNIFTTR